MNVTTTTTSSSGVTPTAPQVSAPKPEPHVLLRTSEKARASQAELSKSFHGLDTDSVLSAPGMKMLLGEPTGVASLKDGVVHLLHKLSDSLLPTSKGSHYMEALRLTDEYQALKSSGGSHQEKLTVLRQLKHELEHHAPGGSKKELVDKLVKFVDAEISLLETGIQMDQQDKEARLNQDQARVDAFTQELAESRAVSGGVLRREIRGFDRSSLNHVDAPPDRGVPKWAKHEFTYNSLKNDTIDATPQGSVKSEPLMLQDPGLSALSDTFRSSATFTGMGAKVEAALVAGGGDALKALSKDIARDLVKDISSQGKTSETAFAISDGAKFKEELFEAFKANHPGGALLAGKYKDAPPEVRAFLDEVYTALLAELPDRQTAPDKVVIGGKEYTKGALLGEGGFGSVHCYEHTYEVTDPTTGKKSTVVEQIAVKQMKAGKFEEAAAEVRAHQSAMGPQGHENIIGMKGVIQTEGGGILIAMELARKKDSYEMLESLKQAVAAGRISPVAANAVRLTILKDMLRGLQHFQETRGMTHFDVKEPNYFVGQDGRMKLGDFGFARAGDRHVLEESLVDNPIWKAPELLIQEAERERISTEATAQKRATREFVRTQNLTPEEREEWLKQAYADIDASAQLKLDMLGGVIATNKADTWSVGITAYKLFHGEDPFYSSFQSETSSMIQEHGGDPENTLRELGKKHDGTTTGKAVTALDRLLNHMLHPDPAQRPSVTDLLRNPIFDEPFVGGEEAYAMIKELSGENPDPAKLKALSDSLGD